LSSEIKSTVCKFCGRPCFWALGDEGGAILLDLSARVFVVTTTGDDTKVRANEMRAAHPAHSDVCPAKRAAQRREKTPAARPAKERADIDG
jgi:hypothetical protein